MLYNTPVLFLLPRFLSFYRIVNHH